MFLKISKEAELWISRSSLFHSLITDGKKEFLKKLCLTLKGDMLSEFLVISEIQSTSLPIKPTQRKRPLKYDPKSKYYRVCLYYSRKGKLGIDLRKRLNKLVVLSKTNIKEFAQTNRKTTIIFMNSKTSKISDGHRLRFNLTDKMHLRRGDKRVALSELSIYYKWKNVKQ